MKRLNNLHLKVYDIKNIELADTKARKHKSANWGVIKHDRKRESDNIKLSNELKDLIYSTSPYTKFTIYEPKERIIFRLPYYPDRITHHAIMNIMEPIWVNLFISLTYSCIKERGIHKLAKDIKKALGKDPEGTKYCLKLDIVKFYPSIDHNILKNIIRRKIKDKQLLRILDEIIDSADGVPIGNYLSLFFANLYLTYFDHWIKEELKIKYYYRYADDIVILGDDKEKLHNILIAIKFYLKYNLKLSVKPNYLVFPVDSRGIDFVGYRFFHTHTLLRKSIKNRLWKLISKYEQEQISLLELDRRLCSYFGWLKYCDSKHLLEKIELKCGLFFSNWNGQEDNISSFYKKRIYIIEIVTHSKYYEIHFIYNNRPYVVISRNKQLFLDILNKNKFPTTFKLKPYVRRNKSRNKHKA